MTDEKDQDPAGEEEAHLQTWASRVLAVQPQQPQPAAPSEHKRGSGKARTLSARTNKRQVLAEGELYPEQPGVDYHRPRYRGECEGTARPCPFVSCSAHLYLDVDPKNGTIKFNFPGLEVWELTDSCSIDVAQTGDKTLIQISRLLNVTRERVRQIETKARAKGKTNDKRHGGALAEHAHDEGFGKRPYVPDRDEDDEHQRTNEDEDDEEAAE